MSDIAYDVCIARARGLRNLATMAEDSYWTLRDFPSKEFACVAMYRRAAALLHQSNLMYDYCWSLIGHNEPWNYR